MGPPAAHPMASVISPQRPRPQHGPCLTCRSATQWFFSDLRTPRRVAGVLEQYGLPYDSGAQVIHLWEPGLIGGVVAFVAAVGITGGLWVGLQKVFAPNDPVKGPLGDVEIKNPLG